MNNIESREFDISPSTGHRERFIAKLDSELPKNQKRIIRFQALTIAASIVILVGVSIIFMLRMNQFNQHKALLVNASTEVYEAEMYYQQSIETGLNTLKTKIDDTDDLLADLGEMDQSLKKVNEDLKKNPGDDRIVQAILIIYQTKLDLITDVLSRLQ